MEGAKGFIEGGIAAVTAGCSTHPIDLIKVRMQLQGELLLAPSAHHLARRPALAFHSASMDLLFNHTPPPPSSKMGPISIGASIVRTEGVKALFSGVSATVLRQSLYSTTCMGLYDMFKQKGSDPVTGQMPLTSKILAGFVAGGIGATVGNPADVSMVRMQADGRLPLHLRRNYKSVVDAIIKIVQQEGIGALWRGSSLTVKRAMIVSASQLASYDHMKETILKHGVLKDGFGAHVASSMVAGFVAAVTSTPVDVMKTRVMNMKVEPGKPPLYSGVFDCLVKTVRAEGVMALYKGFVPILSRQAPFTIVLFVTLEQVKKLLKDY
uniref:Uncharacterized protein n=1 Tax=Kalanchoe fedtschenkoi TaxID=63787 RepID=A0A7N0V579_KALFE